jgi:hypothetical protein
MNCPPFCKTWKFCDAVNGFDETEKRQVTPEYVNMSYPQIILHPGGRAVLGVGLDRLVTEIVGSNPAQGMYVCLCVYLLCCPV